MGIFDMDRYAEEHDVALLKADGFDDCCIGIMTRMGQPDILCYSVERVIAKLMEDDMTREDAYEYYEFNIIGSWVGELTPCFLLEPEEPE